MNPVRPLEYEIQFLICQLPFETALESVPPAQALPNPVVQPRTTKPSKCRYCPVSEYTPVVWLPSVEVALSMMGVAQSSALKVRGAAAVPVLVTTNCW